MLFASFGDGFVPENDYEEDDIVEEEHEVEEGRVSSRVGEYGRLYVGNLPYSMNSSQLAQAFEKAGRVINVERVYDRVTDRSRGFGFMTMGSVEEANEAIRMFDVSLFQCKLRHELISRGRQLRYGRLFEVYSWLDRLLQ